MVGITRLRGWGGRTRTAEPARPPDFSRNSPKLRNRGLFACELRRCEYAAGARISAGIPGANVGAPSRPGCSICLGGGTRTPECAKKIIRSNRRHFVLDFAFEQSMHGGHRCRA